VPVVNGDHFVTMSLEIQQTSRSRSLVMIGLPVDAVRIN
jgi:hypothetical protein